MVEAIPKGVGPVEKSGKGQSVSSFIKKNRSTILYATFTVLFAAGLFLIIYSVASSEFNPITYLSAGSTFIIAFLTAAYVLTTTKQLDVMSNQLDEMKKNRELESQPLPWISEYKFIVERPRVFYTPPDPPDKRCEAHAMFHAKVRTRNIGNSTAICVDVLSKVHIPEEDDYTHIESGPFRVDTLEEKQDFPQDDGYGIVNYSSEPEEERLLLSSLRESNSRKLPRVHFYIYYRNILGTCFKVYFDCLLLPKDKHQDETLGKWLTRLTSFSIENKRELDRIKQPNRDEATRHAIFESIKGSFEQTIEGDDIELGVRPIPGSFQVTPIDVDEYEGVMGSVGRGVPIPPSGGCIHE